MVACGTVERGETVGGPEGREVAPGRLALLAVTGEIQRFAAAGVVLLEVRPQLARQDLADQAVADAAGGVEVPGVVGERRQLGEELQGGPVLGAARQRGEGCVVGGGDARRDDALSIHQR